MRLFHKTVTYLVLQCVRIAPLTSGKCCVTTKDNIADVQKDGEPSGALDTLRANTPAVLTNNAPRVVAVLKILGCSAMCLSKNGCFAVAGAGFIIAHSIMGLFAGKKSEEEKERLRKKEEGRSKTI